MIFDYKVDFLVNTINMKKEYLKTILLFIIPLLILTTLSLLNLFYAPNISDLYVSFLKKQVVWYLIAYLLFGIILFINTNIFLKYSLYIYIFNIILLVVVLFLGNTVNGSKAWFKIGFLSFQPSEFMKLSLILYLTKVISNTSLTSNKSQIILIIRIILIFLLPSILTFLEPDTGAIIIYFVITLGIFFASKINKRYFYILGFIFVIIATGLITLLTFNKIAFIKIFGSSMYYRIERLANFNKGMQIENALITIGNSHFFNLPSKALNLYFPEAITDFIFALTFNNFGIIGGLSIIICYMFLDIVIITNIYNVKNTICKLLTTGFFAMFFYQQIQNILMNIGLLPIIGIPLPFVSYGGSSLILYFICLSMIIKLNIKKEKYSYRVFYR